MMKIATLFSILVLVCSQNSIVNGNDQSRSFLRSQENGQVIAAGIHRFLATPESVPFVVAVNIGKGSDEMNLEPTATDYNAVAASVVSWFDTESKVYYADFNSFSYESVACEIRDNGKPVGFYDTNAADYDDRYQHQLTLDCHAKFNNTQPENEPSNVPSPLDVVSGALASYSMVDFMSVHFALAMPVGGAFDHARRVSLLLKYSILITAAPTTSANSNSTTAPMNPLPYNNSMPHNSSPPTSPGANTSTSVPATGLVTVPMVLQWTLGPPNLQDLREPTDQEYTDFVSDTQTFLKNSMVQTFNLNDGNEQLADFVSVERTVVRSKTYNATSEDTPYKIVVEYETSFRTTPGTTSPPPMWQWVGALRIAGLTSFRTNYIEKRSGIFQNPRSIQWQALEEPLSPGTEVGKR